METVTLHIVPGSSLLSEEEFFQFCQANKGLRIERNHKQEIIIMSPTGFESSEHNAEFVTDLMLWNRKQRLGHVTESNGAFLLPDGSVLCPDAAWVSHARLVKVNPEDRKKFLPICPDFVVELKSPSDRWEPMQEKAQRWLLNGCQMVWLVHPEECRVEVVTAQGIQAVNLREQPQVSGEPVLPGFVADLSFLIK
jgi:Uma2 family endonuclease